MQLLILLWYFIDILAAYLTELDELLSENSRRDDVLLDEFYAAGGSQCPLYVLIIRSQPAFIMNEVLRMSRMPFFTPVERISRLSSCFFVVALVAAK